MESLNDQGVFISSSLDKTIKVWDMAGLLQVVHPIDRMELGIQKLYFCQTNQKVITLTRNGVGLWNIDTGSLENVLADSPTGGLDRLFYFPSVTKLGIIRVVHQTILIINKK